MIYPQCPETKDAVTGAWVQTYWCPLTGTFFLLFPMVPSGFPIGLFTRASFHRIIRIHQFTKKIPNQFPNKIQKFNKIYNVLESFGSHNTTRFFLFLDQTLVLSWICTLLVKAYLYPSKNAAFYALQ